MTFAITQEEIRRRHRRLTIIIICSLATVAFIAWVAEGENPLRWLCVMLITAVIAGIAARLGAKRAMNFAVANPITVSGDVIQVPWASGLCQIEPGAIQRLTISRRGSRVNKITIKVKRGPKIPLIGYERMDDLAQEIRNRVSRDVVS
jgi:hypothetical protein